ncbi:MAG: hypothetical protein F6K36_26235 [Symploca sp. SIO3C6]|nr:hypothetical protein [Symploca sp. SIO3C6]NET05297.1 hypothetical protein [Symploca sp. SIO2B6]NET51279.1 hypothetical protein [Merismopedia sp. SIO2A8]
MQVKCITNYKFHSSQIVYLEYDNARLYGEVIEFVESRQVCWVRPLMLVVPAMGSDLLPLISLENLTLYDLRQGADLLLSACLFQQAFDSEVIPLLVELNNPETQLVTKTDTHQQLRDFVSRVWEAYTS